MTRRLLPGIGYRSWFLLLMPLLPASEIGARYRPVVMVEPTLGGGPGLLRWLGDVLRAAYSNHGKASLGIAMRCALLVGIPGTLFAPRRCTD